MTTAATTCQALPRSLGQPWEAETVVLILQKRKLRLREAHSPSVTELSRRVVAVWRQGGREKPAEGSGARAPGLACAASSLFNIAIALKSWMRPRR